ISNPNFNGNLSYTTTDVFFNLTSVTLGAGTTLNQNQQTVANGINTFFNNGGTVPAGFAGVLGLTGQSPANALTHLSAGNATGMQQTSFLSSSLFLNAMLDPFVEGRGGNFGASPGAAPGSSPLGYAPEQRVSADAASAYAAYLKAPPMIAEQRFAVWGASY